MRHLVLIYCLVLASSLTTAQIVVLNPTSASGDDLVTLVFDASQGNKELQGADQVYVHLGIVTDRPDGTSWQYVIGNWGQDDGIGKMTKINENQWSIQFSPTIRAFFNVPNQEPIFRLACVFRNADGSKKGTMTPGKYPWGTVASNSDFFINLKINHYITLAQPMRSEGYFKPGETLNIQATASSPPTEMGLWIDEGQGFIQKAMATQNQAIQYVYQPLKTQTIQIKITANFDGEELELVKSYHSIIIKDTEIVPIPLHLKPGVNYDANDPSKATLVLIAPNKDFVYVVGDFTDWLVSDDFQMKRTPDGSYFWLDIFGLNPDQDYVYQYWIDGDVKVADPYAKQVADPWNDASIEPDAFPNLPKYDKKEWGIASVLNTGQQPYPWASSESQWKRPNADHLVIYELHLRDFLGSHSYRDLADTLSYLKRLGVNAIELMPINEFEGNDSWGYNPSFYFATDKYYGTATDLKRFIELAHQQGIAVILDIVLNHAFGQCPMVQMYFDNGKPAANNPWFNREYIGQYQWGYDFNHESPYTQRFVDDVNRYWLEEFHFDGFRFDFTKGFTNYAPGGNIDGFDQSRINILKRMADQIRATDPSAYIILEHWGTTAEETQLAAYGMKMWRNKSYDFVPAVIGNTNGTFANHDDLAYVSFFNSHDERRIAEHCLTEGKSTGFYDIKDTLIMFERIKLAAAFTYLQPGPKMIWQFDELGYDIDINYNGRTGRKPYVWGDNSLGYYNSPLRQNIYKTYQSLLTLRKTIGASNLATATKSHKNTGETRRLSFDTPGIDLVVIGNVSLNTRPVNPQFTKTGWWYNYFSGDSIFVSNVTAEMTLKPGEWHVFTSTKVSDGFGDITAVYDHPVTITPYPFKASDHIKIQLNTAKAWPGDTQGLKHANKVYMHAGIVTETAKDHTLTHIVGTLKDDDLGIMTKVNDTIWEIELTPMIYFNVQPEEVISRLGMWFRNEDNTQKGYGFRNSIVYFDVLSEEPILSIVPASFDYNSDITITFNAAAGNRELMGAEKVYMHSGLVIKDTATPKGSDWSHVVGNWGTDNGIGLMTRVPNKKDLWQIHLNIKDYYKTSASEHPFWLAAVFRNATGTVKGTTPAGSYDFGIVDAASQDFFIKNQQSTTTSDNQIAKITIYPNPAHDHLFIQGIQGSASIELFNVASGVSLQKTIEMPDSIDISKLASGLYLYLIHQDGKTYYGKIIIL